MTSAVRVTARLGLWSPAAPARRCLLCHSVSDTSQSTKAMMRPFFEPK